MSQYYTSIFLFEDEFGVVQRVISGEIPHDGEYTIQTKPFANGNRVAMSVSARNPKDFPVYMSIESPAGNALAGNYCELGQTCELGVADDKYIVEIQHGYSKTLTLDKEAAHHVDFLLSSAEEMGEDNTYSETVRFPDGMEMDIKICGSDGENPWTEAVLFKNGSECGCSDPDEDFFGEWSLEYEGITYRTNLVREDQGEDVLLEAEVSEIQDLLEGQKYYDAEDVADMTLGEILENSSFELTGITSDVLKTWQQSSDRAGLEKLFLALTDCYFGDFVTEVLSKIKEMKENINN